MFSLLILAMTESLLRGYIMQVVVGVTWQYQLIMMLPTWLSFGLLAAAIACFAQAYLNEHQLLSYKNLLICLAITLIYLISNQLLHWLITPVAALLTQLRSVNYQPPYGLAVLLPAYISFLEPTIAVFICYALIESRMKTRFTLVKGLIMGLIIALLHAGIYSIFQILFSQGNILYRLFYYGQFLWEYFALGLLSAYSFALIEKTSRAERH